MLVSCGWESVQGASREVLWERPLRLSADASGSGPAGGGWGGVLSLAHKCSAPHPILAGL